VNLSIPIMQIMNSDPVSVDVHQPFSAAYEILSAEHFHHLPVVDNDRLVGMLATMDVVKFSYSLLTERDDPATQSLLDRLFTIREVMTTDPITISSRATLGEAAKALSAGGFHALPIVDGAGRLMGIVTSTDLIDHMLEGDAGPVEADGERLRLLENVYRAAQLYLHSGLAEAEHARLENALQAAR